MVTQEPKQSPRINKSPLNQHQNPSQNHNNNNNNMSIISPRFKSVAAMAGWDEEALLLASLVVEDTPERNFKDKRDLNNPKSPLSNNTSRRKRRRSRVVSIPVFNLEEDDQQSNCNVQKEKEKGKIDLPKKVEEKIPKEKEQAANCSNSSTQLACMDRLKDELSCAICLEICYEPSTTSCGHSFCKNCLKNAADRCGKRCPKCRQLISNGRSCTINTVLWNTIQLLFPQEIEARKASAAAALSSSSSSSRAAEERRKSVGNRAMNASNHANNNSHPNVGRRTRVLRRSEEAAAAVSSRRGVPNQDEDAALALRLQREEFMEVYRGDSSLARNNLRAMARRAMNVPRNRRV